jgi:hypothetical protein
MRNYSMRGLKRFAVLLPGIIISYFSIRDIFPYFDRRLPIGVAVLVTYILGAYILIPAVIRVYRIAKPASHLPLYCVTPDGFASDPLNIGLITTRTGLIDAMEQAGWYQADRRSLTTIFRQVVTTLSGLSYVSAPVSSLYLFGRKQDIAFEIPVEGGVGSRHHVRFWATTFDNDKRLSIRSIHWQHRREHVSTDELLWVGAASLDSGIAPIKHNFQITHMIAPDTNQERDLIVTQLRRYELVVRVYSVKLDNPYRLANRALRGYLQTDGKMCVVRLVAPKK